MEFIEAPLFTQLLPEYWTDDEYAEMQHYLANDPEAGDVIQGPAASARRGGATRGVGKGDVAA